MKRLCLILVAASLALAQTAPSPQVSGGALQQETLDFMRWLNLTKAPLDNPAFTGSMLINGDLNVTGTQTIGSTCPGGAPTGSVCAVKVYGDGSALTGVATSPCAKYTIAASALTAAATAQNVTLFTLPARGKITGLTIKEGTQFACSGGCTGISTLTVSIGRTGTETDYAPAWSLMQAVATTNFWDDGGHFSKDMAAHDVVARVTVTNGTPGNLGDGAATRLTAGSVDIWACSVVLP